MKEFPTDDMQMTNIMVVRDLHQSVDFYRDVLGATLYREYGGTSAVFKFLGNWLLLVTGGGPTEDKPNVTFTPLDDENQISQAFTIRVKDCQGSYDTLRSRGAKFLTLRTNGFLKSDAFSVIPTATYGRSVKCLLPNPSIPKWKEFR